MTREEKIKKRKIRRNNRIQKRIQKNEFYLRQAKMYGFGYSEHSISWGRRKFQGKVFVCEMGYSDCEKRGYCNGDC